MADMTLEELRAALVALLAVTDGSCSQNRYVVEELRKLVEGRS
jgi:hypothetical protein